MEQQIIITLIENSTLAGALSLFIWFILKPLVPDIKEFIKNKMTMRGDVLAEVNGNHLHDVPEILETLKRMEMQLVKLDDIKTGIEVVKARINGRN